ncbi:hypothetical protein B0A55_07512 [Friedmanniomyces simplex]|uniref:Tc1-like transposase DDE domain-containing protein n=1 Tax=Friedmanniomyces simplex TaxID=329884 RepID=A0A4U0XZ15_9PEZI|nr:hypothetical protein B0A55_07512 [Friedmanniomyces simplex]
MALDVYTLQSLGNDPKYSAFVLLQDNDGSYGTQSLRIPCRKYKEHLKRNYGFEWYANTPQSPDLNIIEDVWRIFKQRVQHYYHLETKEDLQRTIEFEWVRIYQTEIDDLVLSMLAGWQDCYEGWPAHDTRG